MNEGETMQKEIQLNLEEGLIRIEETVTHGGDVCGPWNDAVSGWPEMQLEIYRRCLGMWTSPVNPTPGKARSEDDKPGKESQAPKT